MRQPGKILTVVLVALIAGCGGGGSEQPAAVPAAMVELPAGTAPVKLAVAGEDLLIGVRRDGQPLVPGLLRRARDGALGEVAVRGTSPYALLARWYSIDSDGDRIVALGGERGGAHSNVRWSIWTGRLSEALVEKPQGFSTFGGHGAGDLVDVVLTPVGPAAVGTWESKRVGSDVAVWTADGDVWLRQSSVGTPLESAMESLGFPMAATGLERGIVIAGWQLAVESGTSRMRPVVWRSSSGNTGWTSTPLPDSGQTGSAVAVRCRAATCGVAGHVDGRLAVWRLAGDAWTRVPGTPPIPVGDRDRMVAPIELDGRLTQLVPDGGKIKIARADGDRWTLRELSGPSGMVTAATAVGDALYLLAGPDENTQTLWRVELGALR
jgi:hypothetical protein